MSTVPPGSETRLNEWVQQCTQGDRRAVARLITQLESHDRERARKAAKIVSGLPRPPHTIGVTGPPGAGKSTLLDYVIGLYRKSGHRVGVIAVDPSSPFSGGALLGDRIRMASHRADKGVFIRSMGNRGAEGGVASAAASALRVLGGAGFDVVLLETVGAGQSATEIIHLVDTVCVVQVPGLGDDIQLMKMGVLETADLFVVNRGDKPEARALMLQLQEIVQDAPGETCRVMRQLGSEFSAAYEGEHWRPDVVLLSALEHSGGDALLAALQRHKNYLAAPPLAEALAVNRMAREIERQVSKIYKQRLARRLAPGGDLYAMAEDCFKGRKSLTAAIDDIIDRP